MPSASIIFSMHSFMPSSSEAGAAIVLRLGALEAGRAAGEALARELHQLGLDALRLQLGQHATQQDGRVAVLARTAVERDHLHRLSAPGSLVCDHWTVSDAGQVAHVAPGLARGAGDARQREGEHPASERAHQIVVEAVAALVVPAVTVLEHLVQRPLVGEREDTRPQVRDQAGDALPPLAILGLAAAPRRTGAAACRCR